MPFLRSILYSEEESVLFHSASERAFGNSWRTIVDGVVLCSDLVASAAIAVRVACPTLQTSPLGKFLFRHFRRSLSLTQLHATLASLRL